jgi:hypothetical protein
MGEENNKKKTPLPRLPQGNPTKDEAVAVGIRIINAGTIIQLLDPLGDSTKEKHQASNMIFSAIQGYIMPPTFIAPSSTSLTIFS